MSNAFDWDCERAKGAMAQYADGDLEPDSSAKLQQHLTACAECRAALAQFEEIDSALTGWGRNLGALNPPPVNSRDRLAASIDALPARRHPLRWIPAAAAAIAAALTLWAIMPHRTPPREDAEQRPFVEIPYLAPLDSHESATVVRIQIRVATLIAVGYKVAADPDEIVPADVLVGPDGRAHAVRVPADINLTGD